MWTAFKEGYALRYSSVAPMQQLSKLKGTIIVARGNTLGWRGFLVLEGNFRFYTETCTQKLIYLSFNQRVLDWNFTLHWLQTSSLGKFGFIS